MGIINVNITPTNSDALLKKTAEAETEISEKHGGVIKIFGELWFCRPLSKKTIPEGTKVQVRKIEGVTLFVEEVKE